MLKYLVEKGAEVNGKDTKERIVLQSAVTKDRLKIVKYLVEKSADVNIKRTNE